MRQLVCQVCYSRFHISFSLWLIGSVIKHCKVSKYYGQDCRFGATSVKYFCFSSFSLENRNTWTRSRLIYMRSFTVQSAIFIWLRYICTLVPTLIYTYTYTCTHMQLYTLIYTYTHAYIQMFMLICMCLYVYMCICVYKLIGFLAKCIFQFLHRTLLVYMCMCIYTHTHIH